MVTDGDGYAIPGWRAKDGRHCGRGLPHGRGSRRLQGHVNGRRFADDEGHDGPRANRHGFRLRPADADADRVEDQDRDNAAPVADLIADNGPAHERPADDRSANGDAVRHRARPGRDAAAAPASGVITR